METSDIILLFVSILIFSSIVLFVVPTGSRTEYVKCYDDRGSEMIGQSCLRNEEGFSIELKLFIILTGSIIIILVDMLMEWNDNLFKEIY